MQNATRGIFYFISFVLLMYGLVDVLDQYKAGEEIHWSVPIIFFGFGTGIPLVMFYSPSMFEVDNSGESGFAGAEGDDGGGGDV